MNISVVYLLHRAGYRLIQFFEHWYIDGFFKGVTWNLNVLERLDHFFALKITLHYIFHPLYQDYSAIGYALGFVFRSFRIACALVVYACVGILAFALYAAWAAIPLFVIYQIFYNAQR